MGDDECGSALGSTQTRKSLKNYQRKTRQLVFQNKNTERLTRMSGLTSLRIGAGEEGQCEEKAGEDEDK